MNFAADLVLAGLEKQHSVTKHTIIVPEHCNDVLTSETIILFVQVVFLIGFLEAKTTSFHSEANNIMQLQI